MTSGLIVDWRQLEPFGSTEWHSKFVEVVQDLQRTQAVRIRSAEDAYVDLVFFAYLANDHDLVIRDRLLALTLAATSGLDTATVVVVACSRRSPPLSQRKVMELMLSQPAVPGTISSPMRAVNTSELGDLVRGSIIDVARRKSLTVFGQQPDRELSLSLGRESSRQLMGGSSHDL